MSANNGSQRVGVLLVISNLEYGGAQRQVVELANHMDTDRFDVHVCSLSPYVPLSSVLTDADRRLHIIHKKFKFDLSVAWRLARLMKRLGTEIVHGYLFDAEIATRLAGQIARQSVVIGSERNTDYFLKKIQLATYRVTRPWVDLVIANSNAGAAFNRRTLGHAESQYRVIHNGVNIELFRRVDGGPVRRELGFADNDFVVGMFASFKEQKNHPLIFAAAKRVLEKTSDAMFLFVGEELHRGMHGSDAYKRSMDELVVKLGIGERCKFIGNRDDVAQVYSACDITVLPSLFEGTPNVLLESMACGVPIVATNVSDNGQIAPDGEVGFLVPLGDEIAMANRIMRFIEDAELKRRMGLNAREWIERHFSSQRLAEKTQDVYLEALSHRSRN